MKTLQVLGPGCAKCEALAANAQAAARAAGAEVEIQKITDVNEIMKFGVMLTPALAVDGEVKVVGRVPPPEELRELLG